MLTDRVCFSMPADEKERLHEAAARTKAYEDRFANPFAAASKGLIDEVIMPHSARKRIPLRWLIPVSAWRW